MTPVLELKDLHVTLRQHRRATELVKGVSFAVGPGECLGILGESGSGKSMSMKAAMGLLDKGFSVSGTATFQGEALLEKSGEEIRRRSLELLEKMRIRSPEEVLEKYPHQLSGGMLQRIMIGIATAMEPALLIADEPTTAIDAITQYEILNEFLRVKQENQTAMVFISHDLNAISRVADRIVVLNQGRVVDEGDFQHILHHAQDLYTRLLVEKRADVMRRYRQVLVGKERDYA